MPPFLLARWPKSYTGRYFVCHALSGRIAGTNVDPECPRQPRDTEMTVFHGFQAWLGKGLEFDC
jgi:hypothetical protein